MKSMTRDLARTAALVVAGFATMGQSAPGPVPLTSRDRQQIEQLSVTYAEALAACDANRFADLFTARGAFVSGFRGRMEGRKKLIELVETERHCRTDNRVALQGPPRVPALTIEPMAAGARATGVLRNVGQYEDSYVKTADGWRFQVREFLTSTEVSERHGQ